MGVVSERAEVGGYSNAEAAEEGSGEGVKRDRRCFDGGCVGAFLPCGDSGSALNVAARKEEMRIQAISNIFTNPPSNVKMCFTI